VHRAGAREHGRDELREQAKLVEQAAEEERSSIVAQRMTSTPSEAARLILPKEL